MNKDEQETVLRHFDNTIGIPMCIAGAIEVNKAKELAEQRLLEQIKRVSYTTADTYVANVNFIYTALQRVLDGGMLVVITKDRSIYKVL